MATCLLTGARGLLGREVMRRLVSQYELLGLAHTDAAPGLRRLDLRDAAALEALLREQRPDAVVHCAAYRDPDFCEEHPDEVRRLNVEPLRVFRRTLPAGVPLLFISSDYVFDGRDPPYTERDRPSPLNLYGRSKLEGEELVLERERGIVLRIPLLVGAGASPRNSGFIAQARAAVLDRTPRTLDNVLRRFPTWTRDVAAAIEFILASGESGIFHYSSLRGGTRYTWTLEIAELLDAPADHLTPSDEIVPRRAVRPRDAQLVPDRLRAMGYTRFTDFKEVAREVLASFD